MKSRSIVLFLIFICFFSFSKLLECNEEVITHELIFNNKIVEIQKLLENGTDIDQKDKYGLTPLMYAVSCNNEELVKLFLEKEADVNLSNKYGCTALFFAVFNNSPLH